MQVPKPAFAIREQCGAVLPALIVVGYQHFDYVWRVVRGFGVSSDLAEDAVQDVFVVVHRRLDDFVPQASYKTWLFAVATRVASDYRRRVARKGPHVALEQAFDVQSSAPDPYRTTLKMQVMARVERFLDTLDDERRAVFVQACSVGNCREFHVTVTEIRR